MQLCIGEGGEDSNDLLDILLNAAEKKELGKKQVVDNLKTILFAGHDTTGVRRSDSGEPHNFSLFTRLHFHGCYTCWQTIETLKLKF